MVMYKHAQKVEPGARQSKASWWVRAKIDLTPRKQWMSIRVPCDSCLQVVSYCFQQKNLKLIISVIARFAKVCCGVYGISFIQILSPLSVLQKQ